VSVDKSEAGVGTQHQDNEEFADEVGITHGFNPLDSSPDAHSVTAKFHTHVHVPDLADGLALAEPAIRHGRRASTRRDRHGSPRACPARSTWWYPLMPPCCGSTSHSLLTALWPAAAIRALSVNFKTRLPPLGT